MFVAVRVPVNKVARRNRRMCGSADIATGSGLYLGIGLRLGLRIKLGIGNEQTYVLLQVFFFFLFYFAKVSPSCLLIGVKFCTVI